MSGNSTFGTYTQSAKWQVHDAGCFEKLYKKPHFRHKKGSATYQQACQVSCNLHHSHTFILKHSCLQI